MSAKQNAPDWILTRNRYFRLPGYNYQAMVKVIVDSCVNKIEAPFQRNKKVTKLVILFISAIAMYL